MFADHGAVERRTNRIVRHGFPLGQRVHLIDLVFLIAENQERGTAHPFGRHRLLQLLIGLEQPLLGGELQLLEHRLIGGARRFVLGLRADVVFLDPDVLRAQRMQTFEVGLGLFVLGIAGHEQLPVVSHRLIAKPNFDFAHRRIFGERRDQSLGCCCESFAPNRDSSARNQGSTDRGPVRVWLAPTSLLSTIAKSWPAFTSWPSFTGALRAEPLRPSNKCGPVDLRRPPTYR
jgi:hypothetical protein